MNISFISAGAGSGKTYRITHEIKTRIEQGTLKTEGLLATTFTRKAAGELTERCQSLLFEAGCFEEATSLSSALIGTVNGVCGSLLSSFALEAGLSPAIAVCEESQARALLRQATDMALDEARADTLNNLCRQFGYDNDEWLNQVGDIVDRARANRIEPDAVRRFGPSSAQELLSFFFDPSDRPLDSELLEEIGRAIVAISECGDSTKKTADYLAFLQKAQTELQQGRLGWSDWVKLSKETPAKTAAPLSGPVKAAAAQHEAHPALHDAITTYTTLLFGVAADTLQSYQEIKKERALMDFVDQEWLLLDVLDNPVVKRALKERLQLLVVDEFQDTSPIQLALFLKLAALSHETLWVGDVKQAIYGFRGSDPELMAAALEGVKAGGGALEVLAFSWRSVPQVVAFNNELFGRAFDGRLPREQVVLQPKQPKKPSIDPLERWSLEGSSAQKRSSALAKHLKSVVQSPDSGVAYGDIAILCRKNDRVRGVVEMLSLFGIPSQMASAGLLQTPEAALALAALRVVMDKKDALAKAELLALGEGEPLESWLSKRLSFLESNQSRQEEWLEDLGLVQMLATHRKQLSHLSPFEALSMAIEAIDAPGIISQWHGSSESLKMGLARLDALLNMSRSYEQACAKNRQAATMRGLYLWLGDQAKEGLDAQPSLSGADAVTVMTCHASKGLEWPVTILLDLSSAPRMAQWGLHVLPAEHFDFAQPLKGRALRFYPWPYGQQKTDVAPADRLAQSPFGQRVEAVSTYEAIRLLYVAATRARDKLVLAIEGKKQAWLEMLGEEANEWLQRPDGIKSVHCPLPEVPLIYQTRDSLAQQWITRKKTTLAPQPRRLQPSYQPPMQSARVGHTQKLSARAALSGSPDMRLLGLALHGVLLRFFMNTGIDETEVANLLCSHQMQTHLQPSEVFAMMVSFKDYIQSLEPLQVLPEAYISHTLASGQIISGQIDLLVETKSGWHVFDYKSAPKRRELLHEEAIGYSGQLQAYSQAIAEATKRPVVGRWIFYAVAGELVEVV